MSVMLSVPSRRPNRASWDVSSAMLLPPWERLRVRVQLTPRWAVRASLPGRLAGMRSDDLLLPWLESLRADIPELELFDAHTHIGQSDPDGYTCSPDELLAALAMADARGVVFAMHEPGGYPEANDRVLAAARGSDGRLVALCRVDPDADPAGEAERSLDAGAAGIELHPRSRCAGRPVRARQRARRAGTGARGARNPGPRAPRAGGV